MEYLEVFQSNIWKFYSGAILNDFMLTTLNIYIYFFNLVNMKLFMVEFQAYVSANSFANICFLPSMAPTNPYLPSTTSLLLLEALWFVVVFICLFSFSIVVHSTIANRVSYIILFHLSAPPPPPRWILTSVDVALSISYPYYP